MEYTLGERQKCKFTGGWSQQANVNGREYWLILKRGRYVGKRYGNHCWKWHAFVYEDGKQLAVFNASKNTTAKRMLEQVEK